MNEHPILFSTPMVQAILAGRKTQTRRIVKAELDGRGLRYCNPKTGWEDWHGGGKRCPYGIPGDLIWVKETHYAYGWWVKEGKKWRFVDFTQEDKQRAYRFFNNPPAQIYQRTEKLLGWYKRPSLFMPKEAARIWLKVTDIRVERLQDINEEDAKAEGMACLSKDGGITYKWGIPDKDELPGNDDHGWHWKEWAVDPKKAYQTLWEKINGPGSWDANPWVWVISFDVISTTGKPDTI